MGFTSNYVGNAMVLVICSGSICSHELSSSYTGTDVPNVAVTSFSATAVVDDVTAVGVIVVV
jgi:hypothetical protein